MKTPQRKGIIMASGCGTRLYPMTSYISKHLLPVYDKPMIYYPLATLMHLDLRDIIIIVSHHNFNAYNTLLGDGSKLGIHIQYVLQDKPTGIASVYLFAASIIGNSPSILILGDNIFDGEDIAKCFPHNALSPTGAHIYARYVPNPQYYGVVECNDSGTILSLEEKPTHPRSHYAVTGLYFYDHHAIDFVQTLNFSDRKELEITDLNRCYAEQNLLRVTYMPDDSIWFDAGRPRTLCDASACIHSIQERLGRKIGCVEEIAYRKKWIHRDQLAQIASQIPQGDYRAYLHTILETPP